MNVEKTFKVKQVPLAYPEIGRTTLEESKTVIKFIKKAILLYIDMIEIQFQ